MPSQNSQALTEVEIALLDAIKSIADVAMAMNPNVSRALAKSFTHQRDGKLKAGQPNAAAVFEHLREFVADPAREADREQKRRLSMDSNPRPLD
jgi:hypothetical protein